ncbi:DUF5954 family protein [Kitasatospora acidiphila]|uniref:DUF5954 family protein n=1 Tax=Kitasatospora acidiphila TaxID=2567942 RepID=UPI0015F03DAC|nr:DUF5954 family protein [Kitasatospora acidiphila]
MVNFADSAPAYLTIRVTTPDGPAAELADVEAWQARDGYPDLHSAGSPMYTVAREREEGGWQVVSSLGLTPQGTREVMGMLAREQAAEVAEAGDTETQQRYLAIAERLEWEKIDEVELDGRYRVIRVERFIRTGPDGPEPPRSSDFDDPDDPELRGRTGGPDPAEGFVLDPTVPTGMSEGILKTDLIQLVPGRARTSTATYDDAVQAGHTHPGVVLLPAAFSVAERQWGKWVPAGIVDCPTPFRARDVLSMHLRVADPVYRGLSQEEREAYAAAAEMLESTGCNELTVEDRFLRIIRVERMVRFGPDGPEGPRPSDPDPEDPVMVADQKLRAQGIDLDDDSPIVLNGPAKEFQQLFEAEMARRGKPALPLPDGAAQDEAAGESAGEADPAGD